MFPKKINVFIGLFVLFTAVSLWYFSPVLQGKKLMQSDIQQFRGMSKAIKDFREKNNQEPYWTDAVFSGMPTYQLSAYYPYNYIKKIDGLLRFLPHPADYLFLYFLGFFILLIVLKLDWKLASIGSLAFGFSTYFIVILGVGHNAKAHAIAYMPMVMAGFIWCFQKQYLKGFLLTTFAMALEIHTNHFQMTYYLLFSLLFLTIAFAYRSFLKRRIWHFFKSISFVLMACIISLGLNATNLLATKQYAKYSTRGQSELTITPQGFVKPAQKGLPKSYITEYSYGLSETFNLFIPSFTGGANLENIGINSHTYSFLTKYIGNAQARQFVKSAPTYWGKQPIVAAPAYIGVVVVFLFVLGVFLLKGTLKKWLIATVVFSIVLSWGKNFGLLTDFFIDYVPFYNKFRAITSIQVLAEIAIPLMALLTLKVFLNTSYDIKFKQKQLLKSLGIFGGLLLFFLLFGTQLFDFQGLNDDYYDQMLPGLSRALMADRKDLFRMDVLRSLIFVCIAGGMLWLFIKQKLKKNVMILFLGVLFLCDLVSIAKRYVNSEDFLPAYKVEHPFQKTSIDRQILKDTGHYRVADFTKNFMNDGSTSYFHKSIGGYHAAKLGRYKELVDFYLAGKKHPEILNMLNVKYLILPQKDRQPILHKNQKANGNAWFVTTLKYVNSADEQIQSLNDLDTKKIAVVDVKKNPNVLKIPINFKAIDTLAYIRLLSYKPNTLSYHFESKTPQWTIFSEIYYKNGWNAYIDEKKVPHFNANYVLRGLYVPAGVHKIVFKFEPEVIILGNKITLVSYGLLGFLFVIFGIVSCKDNKPCIKKYLLSGIKKP